MNLDLYDITKLELTAHVTRQQPEKGWVQITIGREDRLSGGEKGAVSIPDSITLHCASPTKLLRRATHGTVHASNLIDGDHFAEIIEFVSAYSERQPWGVEWEGDAFRVTSPDLSICLAAEDRAEVRHALVEN